MSLNSKESSSLLKESSSFLKESWETQSVSEIKCSWESISLKVETLGHQYTILDEISGSANPNEITAIMGESGSGKTSLLSILSGTLQYERTFKLDGCVKLNGTYVSSSKLANYIRFVEYEANIYECMTPYEFLYFRHRLQSNNSCSDRIVRSLLKRFGLEKVAFTPIGGTLFRGISGGEKKRVSIASELIFSLPILIIDEPTSGLDSYSAKEILKILNDLKSTGITIILSLHQPSYEIFTMINKLILIQNGKFVYQGSPNDSISYFSEIGLEVPQHINPTDYYLRILHISNRNDLKIEEIDLMNKLEKKYKEYFIDQIDRGEDLPFKETSQTEFHQQIKFLLWREFINYKRNPFNRNLKVAQILFYSIVNSALYYNLGTDNEGIDNRRGFISRVISTCFSITIYTLAVTIAYERRIVIKELIEGLYGPGSYLSVKILIEIPVLIVASVLLGLVSYPIADMNDKYNYKIWIFFIVVLLSYLHGIVIGCLAGVLSKTPVLAVSLTALFANAFFCFSGISSDPEAGPKLTNWLRFFTPVLFLRDAALKNEFEDLDYNSDVYPDPQDRYNYQRDISTNLMLNLIHLVCIYLLAFIILRASIKKSINI